MATIFILGSGFSASCGLPTQKDLFSDLLQDHNGNSAKDIGRVRDALDIFYPDLKRGYDGYPPFEEFFSLVHVSGDLEPRTGSQDFRETLRIFPKGQAKAVIDSCLRLLRNCLLQKSEEHWRKSKCAATSCAMHRFVQNVKGGDVIVTFNWDALLEQHLQKADKAFGYLGSTTDVTLLKLHGSLSWVMWAKDQRPDQAWSPLDDDYLYALKSEQLGALRKYLGERLPYIVPPSLFKRPTRVTESPGREAWCLARIWEQAYDRIGRAANEVLVIGYSLPLEDYHARTLLRVGIGCCSNGKARITLIDPDPIPVARFHTIVGGHITYQRKKFTGEELESIIRP